MSDSSWVDYVTLKLASLQQQVEELDMNISPGGYIQEAFEKQEEHFEKLEQRMKRIEGKIDLILQKLIGNIKPEEEKD